MNGRIKHMRRAWRAVSCLCGWALLLTQGREEEEEWGHRNYNEQVVGIIWLLYAVMEINTCGDVDVEMQRLSLILNAYLWSISLLLGSTVDQAFSHVCIGHKSSKQADILVSRYQRASVSISPSACKDPTTTILSFVGLTLLFFIHSDTMYRWNSLKILNFNS